MSTKPQTTGYQKRSLRDIVADEYKRCAADPVYFMRKYCRIQHPTRGKINFNLYPFQEDALNQINEHRFNIILKSRQLGISTLVAAYSLWNMIFKEDFSVLVIAIKQDVAKNIITKVRVMNVNLPSWLRVGSDEDNKLSLRLNNGSFIKAEASHPEAGRSEALSLLVLDEAAFIEHINEIWTAATPALSTGGNCIALSTPNGVGNWFHKQWVAAEEGQNKFNPIKLHWTVHPERDQVWRDEQDAVLGTKLAAQECIGRDEIITIKTEDDEVMNMEVGKLFNLMNHRVREYKILTPDGFKGFRGIEKKKKNEYLTIELSNGEVIDCSLNHLFISNGKEKLASTLDFYDIIDTVDGEQVVVNNIRYTGKEIDLYDIIGVDDNNLYIVDGVISHNCDVSFVSSGDSVIDPQILEFYKETYVTDPVEKRGIDGNFWIWEYPDYAKSYMVVADVSRGDGKDYSAAHVIDIVDCNQVAEYRGLLDTKEFGNFLVTIATEYSEALLVIENANVGWAAIQQVINRGYPNLFYMSADLKYVDVERQLTNKYRREERKLVAGFSTTSKSRPLIISKLDEYFRERSITIQSTRTIDELYTFIWKNSRAEAMQGYNDDLVMSLGIGLWVRDTALRLRQEGIDLLKQTLDGITSNVDTNAGIYGGANLKENPWVVGDGKEEIDLREWI